MELIQKALDFSNQSVQAYLSSEHIITRPGASAGIWMSFLLPTAVILSSITHHSVSDVYLMGVTISYGLLISSITFLIKTYRGKTEEYIFIIPPVITYALLFFYNKIGVWFSIGGGFAAYSLNEVVLAILEKSPKSLTYGEAAVLSQAFILFMFTTTNSIVYTWYHVPIHCMDIATIILQVGLLGVVFICTGVYIFKGFKTPILFWGLTLTVLFGFVITFLHILIQQNPMLWIFRLILADMSMVWLLIYCVVCSGLAVFALSSQIQIGKQASTVIRKYFHILAVAVFIPGLIMKCCFLYLATGIILALLIGLELLHILNMPPLGEWLESGFVAFADEKDAGKLALTPIYLLTGCAVPLWLYPSSCSNEICRGQHLLTLMSGLLSIGIGDTAASIFGTWIGKTKWIGMKKTKEGTVAGIFCQMVLVMLLMNFGYVPKSGILFLKTTFAVVLTSLLEAKTDQVDNLALPLVMYILMLPFQDAICQQ